jgi:hypothetical protein
MKQYDFLNIAILGLANLQVILEKKGGSEEDGSLFEEISLFEASILSKFGLPFSTIYQQILWFKTVPNEIEIEERIEQLHKAASQYLLSDVKSEPQILKEAQIHQQDPFIVLPELNIKTTVYSIFVYEKILLKNKDSVENVLKDLKFTNQRIILDALGKIQENTIDQDEEAVEFLESIGVRYLNQFLIHNSNLLDDDCY